MLTVQSGHRMLDLLAQVKQPSVRLAQVDQLGVLQEACSRPSEARLGEGEDEVSRYSEAGQCPRNHRQYCKLRCFLL